MKVQCCRGVEVGETLVQSTLRSVIWLEGKAQVRER